MYENILIPITDGKRMYNISCNLKAAYESESKEVVKSFENQSSHVIDEAWKTCETGRTETFRTECKLRAERPAIDL